MAITFPVAQGYLFKFVLCDPQSKACRYSKYSDNKKRKSDSYHI